MTNTLNLELASHILDRINDGVLTDDNMDDLHFHCFNEDYYIVGYYNAEQWIKEHFVSTFDAINTVKEYEIDTFGEMNTDINSESIANMLAYIKGEDLLSELGLYDITATAAHEILTEYLSEDA